MRHLCWHDTSEQNSCQSSDVETVLSFLRTISFRALHVFIDNGLYFVYLVNKRILVAGHLGWNECSNWRNKLKKKLSKCILYDFPLSYYMEKYAERNDIKEGMKIQPSQSICALQRRNRRLVNTCLMTTNDVSLRNEIQVNLPFREFFPVSN